MPSSAAAAVGIAVATAMFSNAARLTRAIEPMVSVRRAGASRLAGATGTAVSLTGSACILDPGPGQAPLPVHDRRRRPRVSWSDVADRRAGLRVGQPALGRAGPATGGGRR